MFKWINWNIDSRTLPNDLNFAHCAAQVDPPSVWKKYTPFHMEEVSDIKYELLHCVDIVVYHTPTEPGHLVQFHCDCVFWWLKKSYDYHQQWIFYLTCLWCVGLTRVYFEWDHLLYLLQLFLYWNIYLQLVVI